MKFLHRASIDEVPKPRSPRRTRQRKAKALPPPRDPAEIPTTPPSKVPTAMDYSSDDSLDEIHMMRNNSRYDIGRDDTDVDDDELDRYNDLLNRNGYPLTGILSDDESSINPQWQSYDEAEMAYLAGMVDQVEDDRDWYPEQNEPGFSMRTRLYQAGPGNTCAIPITRERRVEARDGPPGEDDAVTNARTETFRPNRHADCETQTRKCVSETTGAAATEVAVAALACGAPNIPASPTEPFEDPVADLIEINRANSPPTVATSVTVSAHDYEVAPQSKEGGSSQKKPTKKVSFFGKKPKPAPLTTTNVDNKTNNASPDQPTTEAGIVLTTGDLVDGSALKKSTGQVQSTEEAPISSENEPPHASGNQTPTPTSMSTMPATNVHGPSSQPLAPFDEEQPAPDNSESTADLDHGPPQNLDTKSFVSQLSPLTEVEKPRSKRGHGRQPTARPARLGPTPSHRVHTLDGMPQEKTKKSCLKWGFGKRAKGNNSRQQQQPTTQQMQLEQSNSTPKRSKTARHQQDVAQAAAATAAVLAEVMDEPEMRDGVASDPESATDGSNSGDNSTRGPSLENSTLTDSGAPRKRSSSSRSDKATFGKEEKEVSSNNSEDAEQAVLVGVLEQQQKQKMKKQNLELYRKRMEEAKVSDSTQGATTATDSLEKLLLIDETSREGKMEDTLKDSVFGELSTQLEKGHDISQSLGKTGLGAFTECMDGIEKLADIGLCSDQAETFCAEFFDDPTEKKNHNGEIRVGTILYLDADNQSLDADQRAARRRRERAMQHVPIKSIEIPTPTNDGAKDEYLSTLAVNGEESSSVISWKDPVASEAVPHVDNSRINQPPIMKSKKRVFGRKKKKENGERGTRVTSRVRE